jgi:acetyltransferase-like isoleucine patch superfamily enzyme
VIVSYNVTIADSDFHPRDPELRKLDAMANAPQGDRSQRPAVIAKPVVIEDDTWVGIGAIVLKGVRIGRGARIGAGAVVTSDVPPGATFAGNPARLIEG